MLYRKFTAQKPIVFCFSFIFLFPFAYHASAQSIATTSLQAQISEISNQQAELQAQIASYESQLADIGSQATTLSAALKSLDATIDKNALDIKLTQNNITAAGLQIQELADNISSDSDAVDKDNQGIAKLIVETYRYDATNLLENFLAYDTISDFASNMENIYKVQNDLTASIADMKSAQTKLQTSKQAAEDKKQQLVAFESSLEDQKQVLAISRQQKAQLLSDTKDKESNYQNLLAQKKAESAALDQELVNFQAGLDLPININSYPAPAPGIFSWPLSTIRVTQLFGVTSFSKMTTAYNGQGHDGVDFGAAIGTPVYAALDGVVEGTGNTDLVCPGASFGKWIFIQHANGLSTMYAHLSLIKVSQGQTVRTGDIIGYTGATGFVTGPHLHFGVYVTEGSKITSYKSKVCDGTYTMPVADLAAYLNPLEYLPNL